MTLAVLTGQSRERSRPRARPKREVRTATDVRYWFSKLSLRFSSGDGTNMGGGGEKFRTGSSDSFCHGATEGVIRPARCAAWVAALSTEHGLHNPSFPNDHRVQPRVLHRWRPWPSTPLVAWTQHQSFSMRGAEALALGGDAGRGTAAVAVGVSGGMGAAHCRQNPRSSKAHRLQPHDLQRTASSLKNFMPPAHNQTSETEDPKTKFRTKHLTFIDKLAIFLILDTGVSRLCDRTRATVARGLKLGSFHFSARHRQEHPCCGRPGLCWLAHGVRRLHGHVRAPSAPSTRADRCSIFRPCDRIV
jgi:hypothetical protein